METQTFSLIIVSTLFLCVVVSISLLIGILGSYAFRRKRLDNNQKEHLSTPKGAPKSLGLLFMRMNYARIIIAITMVYGILVVVILGKAEPALISVFATLGGTSIGGLSHDYFGDNNRNSPPPIKSENESSLNQDKGK
jgi:hypothetical protein